MNIKRMPGRSILMGLMAVSMTFSSAGLPVLSVHAQEQVAAADETGEALSVYNTNLALNKTVSASAQYSSMPASNLVDGNASTRWSAEQAPTQWAYVDLGASYNMNFFSFDWEKSTEYASQFNIYVSDDPENWGTAVKAVTNDAAHTEVTLDEAVAGRYVKLEVTKVSNYPSVSCGEMQVKLVDESIAEQDPQENVALNSAATASSEEASTVRASNAVDGDTSSGSSRWGSNVGDSAPWLQLDLGSTRNMQSFRLYWESRKATSYNIQVSDDGENWTTVYERDDIPTAVTEQINLENPVSGRYVKLNIPTHTTSDPDDTVPDWDAVSLYEFEVYGGIYVAPTDTIDYIRENLAVNTPVAADTKLTFEIPESSTYDIVFNGADYEQVVDSELTIHKPMVDTDITVNFKVTNKATGDYEFIEKTVTIPGAFEVEETDNAPIQAIPELREWKGHSGVFTPAENPKAIVMDESLRPAAEAFAADYEEMFGAPVEVVTGFAPEAGSFFFGLASDISAGSIQNETYYLTIDEACSIFASTNTGAYWGTRSVLQGLKAADGELNQGMARDYPQYQIRGIILDVGRKTFKMDYLRQIVKQMSWYKMNDFQIHLNDNLIPLENYTSAGKDAMTAYSAFRLESDIKEGGNDGLNKADLTAKDVWYTKDEFRNLIQDARNMGVNIVPEIDTPAHSLALTKVRPDLRHGTSGRQNDHLNLTSKYDDSLAFVQGIFSEYMTEENPVWDLDTTVHIGADEYSSSSTAYRRFVNDMLHYVEGTGRKARVWGSFSQLATGDAIDAKGVEINLWNYGWAHMGDMYDEGFDLINCNDGNYYIVPNAGYYYDYLNDGTMYNLAINSIGGDTIPAGDAQMKGGAFAVWNDMCDYLENGVSEYDVYDRINKNMSLFAAKLWGKKDMTLNEAKTLTAELGDAPGTNFGYKIDSVGNAILHLPLDDAMDKSGNDYSITGFENAAIETVDHKNALHLNGGTSYASTDLTTAGLNNDLRLKVKRTNAEVKDQILMESDYGTLKAVQADTGKVGFTRENHDYSFNYTLPINEWVELEFKNENKQISLYVNGSLVDTLGDDERTEGRPLEATVMYPVARIGSTTNAFEGYVDDIRLGADEEFSSTMALDYAIETAWASGLADDGAVIKAPELKDAIGKAQTILAKYNPTAEEIAEANAEIEGILNEYPYRKANYAEVDAYRQLTGNLDSFTDDTVNAVLSALNNIREHLPAGSQEVVDGYAEALENALANLTLKEVKDLAFVDQSTITATASSYQHDGSDPKNVVDGNTGTMWHSDWNITTMPHWIDLEMKEVTEIKGVTYMPRDNCGNGTPTAYDIQVSTDGTNYTSVKSGSCSMNEFKAYEFEFEPVEAKHVRFILTSAKNNNGSCTEMNIMLAHVEPDLEGLNGAIADAKAIVNLGYTDASWTALQDKIAEAEALATSEAPEAQPVKEMIGQVRAAVVALKASDGLTDTGADTSALQAYYNEVKDTEKGEATDSAWNAFQTALASAAEALNSDDQYTVDVALFNLKQAYKALSNGGEVVEANKTLLKKAVEYADGVVAAGGLEGVHETVKTKFEEGLADAKAVLGNPTATQDEVNNAWTALTDAIHLLDFKADKTELKALIDAAQLLDLNQYYDGAEKDAFTEALNNAVDVYTNPYALDETSIKPAVDALKNAMTALETVKKPAEEIDTSLLQMVYDTTKDTDLSKFVSAGQAEFTAALAKAEAVLANPETQAEVNEAAADLNMAYLQLRLKADESLLEELKSFLSLAESINRAWFTAEQLDLIDSVYADVKLLVDTGDVAHEDALTAQSKMKPVREMIEKVNEENKPSTDEVDKDDLYDLLDKYDGYKESDYTASTWKTFKEAYDKAKEVYEDTEADQKAVDDAEAALKKAGAALKKADDKTDNKDDGKKDDGKDDKKDNNKKPSTAAGMGAMFSVSALLGSAGLAGFLSRKRRKNR